MPNRRGGKGSPAKDTLICSPTRHNQCRRAPYKRHRKPPYSYVGLVSMAIMTSPDKMATLSEIYAKLQTWFDFFTADYTGWKDSVRHNLSNNKCFTKVQTADNKAHSKGNSWKVDVSKVSATFVQLQKTIVSRETAYAETLHQQLRLPSLHQLEAMRGEEIAALATVKVTNTNTTKKGKTPRPAKASSNRNTQPNKRAKAERPVKTVGKTAARTTANSDGENAATAPSITPQCTLTSLETIRDHRGTQPGLAQPVVPDYTPSSSGTRSVARPAATTTEILESEDPVISARSSTIVTISTASPAHSRSQATDKKQEFSTAKNFADPPDFQTRLETFMKAAELVRNNGPVPGSVTSPIVINVPEIKDEHRKVINDQDDLDSLTQGQRDRSVAIRGQEIPCESRKSDFTLNPIDLSMTSAGGLLSICAQRDPPHLYTSLLAAMDPAPRDVTPGGSSIGSSLSGFQISPLDVLADVALALHADPEFAHYAGLLCEGDADPISYGGGKPNKSNFHLRDHTYTSPLSYHLLN